MLKDRRRLCHCGDISESRPICPSDDLSYSFVESLARCESLGGQRPPVLLQRHINDRGDGKEFLVGPPLFQLLRNSKFTLNFCKLGSGERTSCSDRTWEPTMTTS